MNLRSILKTKAIEYLKNKSFDEYETAIIFKNIKDNFIEESFFAIEKKSAWKKRLEKPHAKVPRATEMQSSNSSDALLMNIFCYPGLFNWKGVRDLFYEDGIDIKKEEPEIDFGHKPKLTKQKNPEERTTEIDMVIGHTLFEAKLTEQDFTSKEIAEVEKYDGLEEVFDTDKLPKNKDKNKYESYQIIRNFLAAYKENKNHRLLCDIRRGDLVRDYYKIVNAIKEDDLKQRVGVIFWQDIASRCGESLKNFLAEKYGIC